MGLYRVHFEGGHTLVVNANDEDGARRHVDHDRVRDPFLGQPVIDDVLLARPRIPQRAGVTHVETLDKWNYRRLQELEAQEAARKAEITALRAEAAAADAKRPKPR